VSATIFLPRITAARIERTSGSGSPDGTEPSAP
jgi:hypothetical protein